MSEDKWCKDCGRLIGVACACGMTYIEKLRTIQINKESLK